MIEVKNIQKNYGGLPAVKNVSLHVGAGERMGLIGPDGAGKSTVLKIIGGLMQPDSGLVRIGGKFFSPEQRALRTRIGYLGETGPSYPGLSVRDYLEYFCNAYGLYGLKARTRCWELLDCFSLQKQIDDTVDLLPLSLKRRLGIVRTLLHDPDILIYDEPFAGLDTAGAASLQKTLFSLIGEQNKTLLLASRGLTQLSAFCTHFALLNEGVLLRQGTLAELQASLQISEPILLTVEGAVQDAIRILRQNPQVRSIAIDGRLISLEYNGNEQEQAALLGQLIKNNVPVSSFYRRPGTLENMILKIMNYYSPEG